MTEVLQGLFLFHSELHPGREDYFTAAAAEFKASIQYTKDPLNKTPTYY